MYSGMDLSGIDKLFKSPLFRKKQQEWLDALGETQFMKIKKKDIRDGIKLKVKRGNK